MFNRWQVYIRRKLYNVFGGALGDERPTSPYGLPRAPLYPVADRRLPLVRGCPALFRVIKNDKKIVGRLTGNVCHHTRWVIKRVNVSLRLQKCCGRCFIATDYNNAINSFTRFRSNIHHRFTTSLKKC